MFQLRVPWLVLTRSPLVVGGLLLCSLGVANWAIGDVKLSQYEPTAARGDSAPAHGVTLRTGFTFSDVSESHERHNIAVAKVQYYSVVVATGELMVLTGLLLFLVGGLRMRGLRWRLTKNRTLLDSP